MDPYTENIKIYQLTEDNNMWKIKIWSFHNPISCKQSIKSVKYVLEVDHIPRMSCTVNLIWPNADHQVNQFLKDFGCKALLSKVVLPEMNDIESQAVVNNLTSVKENECVKDMIERFASDTHDRGIIIFDDIFFLALCPIHYDDPTILKPDLKPFRWFANFIENRTQKH